MKYDPPKHHRRSIRLKGYDYTQAGAYFVTIVVHNHECLLGDVVDGEMQVNNFGKIVQECWNDLPMHYSSVELDAFVVMPNHVHGIVVICDAPVVGTDHVEAGHVGAGLRPAPTTTPVAMPKHHGLSEIVRAFKSFSARRINAVRDTQGAPVWQRNYFEHIIRNDHNLERIREYIAGNPAKWKTDDENPNHI